MYPKAGLFVPVANIESFRGMGNKTLIHFWVSQVAQW